MYQTLKNVKISMKISTSDHVGRRILERERERKEILIRDGGEHMGGPLPQPP